MGFLDSTKAFYGNHKVAVWTTVGVVGIGGGFCFYWFIIRNGRMYLNQKEIGRMEAAIAEVNPSLVQAPNFANLEKLVLEVTRKKVWADKDAQTVLTALNEIMVFGKALSTFKASGLSSPETEAGITSAILGGIARCQEVFSRLKKK